MDCSKVGNLIYTLRTEKGMTQKALANAMNISDRTISKWERGAGCPDVSLLRELSDILGVNIEKILLGDLEPNKKDGGNMKRIKFYVCPLQYPRLRCLHGLHGAFVVFISHMGYDRQGGEETWIAAK